MENARRPKLFSAIRTVSSGATAVLLFVALLIATISLGQSAITANARKSQDSTSVRESVLRIIREHYFQEVIPDTTVSIDTMVSRLDPFSSYLTKSEYDEELLYLDDGERIFGIGLQSTGKSVVISSVTLRSSGDRAGLLPGDIVNSINDVVLGGHDGIGNAMLLDRATVDLFVSRPYMDSNWHSFLNKVTCDESSVPVCGMIDSQVGYIKMTGFHLGTSGKLQRAIEKLLRHGMQYLVLDLRDNRGGYVTECISAANLFVHSDRQSVTSHSRIASEGTQYNLDKTAAYPSLPLVVLVDNCTCSAGEMFTGILQDLDRAIVVGQPTWGKSLVMQFFSLPNADRLFLTTAYYRLPSGRSVQRPYTNGVLIGGLTRSFGSCDNQRHFFDSDIAEGDCPAFQAASGRTLRGLCGIVPDYFVSQETYDPDGSTDPIHVAAARYLRANASWLLSTTLDSFTRFCEIPEKLVESALDGVRTHDTTKAKHSSLEMAWVAPTIIKAYIAWSIWGGYGFFKLWEKNSATVRRATELLRSKSAPIAVLGK